MSSDEIKPSSQGADPGHQTGILDEKRFGKYFLLIVFVLSLLLFINVVKIFILEVILAAVFATLFYPVFRVLLRLFNNQRGVAAFVSCILVLVGILIPLAIISNIVVRQAIDLYTTMGPRLSDLLQKGDAGILGQLKNSAVGKWMSLHNIDWQSLISDATKNLGATVAKVINRTSRATLIVIIDLFIILFSVFYFLRDGERMLKRVKEIVPLSEEYKDLLVERFTSISRATVKGTLFIALIQSFLGTMTLMVFGIDAWMLWGVVMLVFAVIPFVGPGAVLIPTGIIQIIAGDVLSGLAIIAISIFVVSTIDNFLRPRIVGHHAGMHDLLVFFSTLGGISMFGPVGFIIGPLITAIFLTMLDIYSVEFQVHIESAKKPNPKKPSA